MHDPLDLALRLGADRDDVAPGAQGHDRLADDPGHRGRAQHRVQALAHAILGGAQPLPERGELRRRGVEDLAGLVDAARDPGRAARARRPARRGPRRDAGRARSSGAPRTGRWRASVSATSRSSAGVSRPPRPARSSAARMSRAPPMVAWAWSASSRTASSVWSWSRPTWTASASGMVARPARATVRRRSGRPAARRSPRTRARAGSRVGGGAVAGSAAGSVGVIGIQKRRGRSVHSPA